MAKRGYNLILVARRKDRLATIADELIQKYHIKTEIFPADLSKNEEINRVAERIKDCDELTMLVNNAGFGAIGEFTDNEWDIHASSHSVMLMAIIKLTHSALENMRERQRGDIINVSSVSGFLKNRGAATYSAIKAYINTFSYALNMEVRDNGVRVQALCPGFTHTEFHATESMTGFEKNRIPKWMWLKADFVVEKSLRCLKKNKPICIPSLRYKLIVFLVRNSLIGWIINKYARR